MTWTGKQGTYEDYSLKGIRIACLCLEPVVTSIKISEISLCIQVTYYCYILLEA